MVRIGAGYATLVALGAAVVFALPGWSGAAWAVIGLLTVAAMGYGGYRHRPRRRLPWLLVAGAVLAMATGDALYGFAVRGRSLAAPLAADLCYLAMFPLVIAGLVMLTRASVVLRDRGRLLDLLVMVCGGALIAWVVLIGPIVAQPGLDAVDRSAAAVFAMGGLLLVVTAGRLVTTAPRNPAVLLLAAGALAGFVADVVYTNDLAGSGWRPGNPAELGYLLFYGCWGLAALQPSMQELTEPVPAPSRADHGRPPVALALALLVPPGLLLVEALAGPVRDGLVIAIAGMLMLVLVATRLGDMVERHRRATGRELALRQACAELVGAADAAAVGAAVRRAVGDLMPPAAEYRVVFAASHTGGLPTAGMSVWGPALPAAYPAPPTALARRTRVLPARALHPALRDQLGHFAATLVCPLVLDGRSGGDRRLGALFVAAQERLLAALQDSIEVLAAQATLALERIALTDEVNRRDGDRYVRTIVQNTADAVLIADEDGRIRYASPSLATLLGVAAPAFATLRDIVHPDEQDQPGCTLDRSRAASDPGGVRDDWTLRGRGGDRVPVEVICRDLRQDRMVRGFVLTLRNPAARREQEQEAIRRALGESSAGQNRRSALNRFS
ncbi:PAS domain S-box protein [Rhizomonospora bruguierae]|uniref:PAS domain S-box protein n=1 Tax=Rhizomonospora bruguierae TaxID=1581705 RepID=UPI001BCE81B0|nr:PAS domain S-box protein [Micromonospora sp. NBRC 107566]